ncbi:MAG: 50S ribosomal protein L19 [Candidatus Babeliales bacterium]
MKAQKFTKETIRSLGTRDLNFPAFGVGDVIAVSQRIAEGDKERIQIFEGDVIAMRKNGASSTFTVRKISANAVSVEKIFPFYSPMIAGVKFIRKGKARRAKLYYMRNRIGKAARVQEVIQTKEEKAAQASMTSSFKEASQAAAE